MLYRLAKIAAYKQANFIEENNGKALVKVGTETKKIFLSESPVASYAEGDIIRVNGRLALVIMRSRSNFLLLIGKQKEQLTFAKEEFIPFDPLVTDSDITSKTQTVEWGTLPQLSKQERRQRAAYYEDKYGIMRVHAFNVVDGKMTLSEAIKLKNEKNKRTSERELLERGIDQDLIHSFREDNITFDEAINLQKDRDKNSDLVGSTEDYYVLGTRVGGSFGSSSR